MKKILRTLVSTALAISLAGTLAPVVFADTQGSDCVGDSTVVRLWENPINDTSDGNDSVWLCDTQSNLANISHLPPGNCHSPFFGSTTWSDCVDSYTIRTPTGVWICFYKNANYVAFEDSRQGWNERFNILSPDTLTSFVFTFGSTC
jgi:hypothetical protein